MERLRDRPRLKCGQVSDMLRPPRPAAFATSVGKHGSIQPGNGISKSAARRGSGAFATRGRLAAFGLATFTLDRTTGRFDHFVKPTARPPGVESDSDLG